MTQTPASRLHALACSLLVIVCTLAARPFAEMGMDDDYSYIFSARALAQTGHVHYVGWASAMVGWQLALGAAFIRLFGFSFSITRASVLLIAAVTAFLLHRLLVRSGLTSRNAVLVTLATLLSPMALPLGFSFMTDMAGLFGTVVALYCCVRALQAAENRASTGWLVAAMVLTAVGGTARQTVWLCLFLMVPATVWLLRSRKLPLALLAPVWIASLAFAWLSLKWFYRQPYSVRELALQGYIDRDLIAQLALNLLRAGLQCCLLALPVLIAFVALYPRRNRRALIAAAAVGTAACAAFLLAAHRGALPLALLPFRVGGNFFSASGVVDLPEIGMRPVAIPVAVQLIVTLVTLAATVATAAFLLVRNRTATASHEAHASYDRRETAEPLAEPAANASSSISTRELLWLIVPFTLVYLLLVLHRALFAFPYDRYFITLLPLAMLLVVRAYQRRVRLQLPAISFVALATLAAWGIASLHDTYADRRATLAAAQRLIDAGVPRIEFYGGFEYDGWTQIDQMGWMNVIEMQRPDGFHHERPIPRAMKVKPCGQQFAHLDPAIQPRYGISFDQQHCDGPSEFAPETYHTWLPPFTRQLYIRTNTKPAF